MGPTDTVPPRDVVHPASRWRRLLLVGAAVLVAAQCGKEPAGPEGPPPATKLAFIAQPSNTTAGVALAPAVQVAAQDPQGGTATGFTGSIIVALSTNPSGATLLGTTTVNAVAGVATFAALSVDREGAGYTLVASASGLASATSASFDAVPRVPEAVSVFPVDAFLFVGDSVQLAAVVTDARGQLIGGVPISWSSSNENVASVDLAGKVRTRGAGLATITATITAPAGDKSAQSTIQVNRTASVDRRINSPTVYPHQEEPSLVIDRTGRLFAAWKEMNFPAGVNRVALSYSLDGGVNWSTAVLAENHALEGVGGPQSDPWLAVDENARLYFGRLEGDLRRIVVSHSDDGGLTWSSPVDVLDWDARQLIGLGRVDKPSLVADGNSRVFVAYYGEFDTSNPINVVTQWSTDGGASWSPSVRMDSSDVLQGTTSQAPVMAVGPDGTLYTAWWSRPVGPNNRNGNIVVVASRDRGTTWSGGVRVNPIAGSAPLRFAEGPVRLPFPSIVVGPRGRVFVAWQDWDGADWDVVVSWSDDRGASWSAPVRISDVKRGDQWFVALGVDAQGTLHAAWYDSRSGDINLVYARSTDDGRTWSPNVRATTRATPGPVRRLGDYIGIAVGNDGTAYLAWTDGRGADLDIYFARSTGF